MFSGIVENTATATSTNHLKGKTYSLHIDLNGASRSVHIGDSIAVNGVCLTVVGKKGTTAIFEVIKETLQRTNLGQIRKESKVNIERSISLNTRISGHIVTGHVDGTGKVKSVQPQNDGSTKMAITATKKIAKLMIEKGAVAVDGVSLTIVDACKSCFSVCLIPHTLKATTLGLKKKSDLVNIEADYIGKYVLKLANRYQRTLSVARA